MVSVEDRPVFFVHQTQKQNIDKYQKNRVCFPLSPNITVEYTPTPNTVKIAASVEDAFKSELKGFRTISTTFSGRHCKKSHAVSDETEVLNRGCSHSLP
jgi:hypothetical protein